MRFVLAGLFMLALGASPTGEGLSLSWPGGVPDAQSLGWQAISGATETPSAALLYTFYVNPARGAIYELARYRYVKVDGVTRIPSTEKLVWNQYPSQGKGPQCYALEASVWRTLERGSDEYRSEMLTTIYVYGAHRHRLEQR
jgi:hypothetical protein